MRKHEKGIYEKYFKRLQDFLLALIAIIFLSPLLVIVYVTVIISMGYPAIFKQSRSGLGGKPFVVYKFRTMNNNRDEHGNLLEDKLRVTKLGKWLRRMSIDELPQLFNILKGEMSIIGPRPQLEEFLPLYNDFQLRRHEVRPGLSGLAQVNGRNGISWAERFEYDVEYVDNVTFMWDWKIIFLTIKKVIIREGINSSEEETMERFRG